MPAPINHLLYSKTIIPAHRNHCSTTAHSAWHTLGWASFIGPHRRPLARRDRITACAGGGQGQPTTCCPIATDRHSRGYRALRSCRRHLHAGVPLLLPCTMPPILALACPATAPISLAVAPCYQRPALRHPARVYGTVDLACHSLPAVLLRGTTRPTHLQMCIR